MLKITDEEIVELTERSRQEFEMYAGYYGDDLSLAADQNALRELQIRFARWEVKNFGWQDSYRPLLGVGEEVLEELEDVRDDSHIKTKNEFCEKLDDCAADAGIFMMNMLTGLRLDIAVIDEFASKHRLPAHWAARGVGRLNKALLKYEQGIRGMDKSKATQKIVTGCYIVLAGLYDLTNVRECIIKTAPEVLARDWTKNKLTGAPVS